MKQLATSHGFYTINCKHYLEKLYISDWLKKYILEFYLFFLTKKSTHPLLFGDLDALV